MGLRFGINLDFLAIRILAPQTKLNDMKRQSMVGEEIYHSFKTELKHICKLFKLSKDELDQAKQLSNDFFSEIVKVKREIQRQMDMSQFYEQSQDPLIKQEEEQQNK